MSRSYGSGAVDAAVEEMFDRIAPLAWLHGFAREDAKEQCRKIIAHAVEPLFERRDPWD